MFFKNIKRILFILFLFGIFHSNCSCSSVLAMDIPIDWFTFKERTTPFIPYKSERSKKNQDKKIEKFYKKPIKLEDYAEDGWEYNTNYKPYFPGKYIWATSDYSYKTYLSKNKKYSDKYCQYSPNFSPTKCDNIRKNYNDWLWNKIREDYRKHHALFSKVLTLQSGEKKKFYKEDGGIISIYEQRNVFFQYQMPLTSEFIEEKHLKFLQNFRHKYKNVRVNNPYLEFNNPKDTIGAKWFTNQLFVKIYQFERTDNKIYPFNDKYQKKIKFNDHSFIAYAYFDTQYKKYELGGYYSPLFYIGPDGKKYYSDTFPSKRTEFYNYIDYDKQWEVYTKDLTPISF